MLSGGRMIRRREPITGAVMGAGALGLSLTRTLLAADPASPLVATKYGNIRGTFVRRRLHAGICRATSAMIPRGKTVRGRRSCLAPARRSGHQFEG